MEKSKLFKNLIWLLSFGIFLAATGCSNSALSPNDSTTNADQAALTKIVDEDSSLQSFIPNYDEDSAMQIIGINSQIYPIRVGQHMTLVNRDLNITVDGDTAYGALTKTFDGTLFILASLDSAHTQDTLIQKHFTSVINRNLIFRRFAHTDNPIRDWKIIAISLPEGGTQSENIMINRLTIKIPDSQQIVIENPTEYFLGRGNYFWRKLPFIRRNEPVHIKVELTSAYADTDFVTLTYGARWRGEHRTKRLFELTSSVQNGNKFNKVYEQNFTSSQFPGFYHVIINALPKQVIFDDNAPVESNSWGIPYFVTP